jgi:light-regulated signal transduction histidine kinase (bacteriophytochrome)
VTAIQPCALLFLVGPDWRVETISANAGLLEQGKSEDLLGRPLAQLIGSDAIHALRNRMAWLSRDDSSVHDFGVRWGRCDTSFDIHARRRGDYFLIEAEQAVEGRLPDAIGMVQSLLDRIDADRAHDIAGQGLRQLSALTGFNRLVLLNCAGDVVGRSERGALLAPAPESSARPGNTSRIIADCASEAVPLLGKLDDAMLRETIFPAPGEAELDHLSNGGIRAVMTLPLRIDGEWVGTIEAHHSVPRRCGAERRAVAGMFADRLAARMARHGWTP